MDIYKNSNYKLNNIYSLLKLFYFYNIIFLIDDTNDDNQIDYILAQEPETEVDMPKRQLSDWGKYCCVTYTETKELVVGSPLYSAMYQVINEK